MSTVSDESCACGRFLTVRMVQEYVRTLTLTHNRLCSVCLIQQMEKTNEVIKKVKIKEEELDARLEELNIAKYNDDDIYS